jgi:hypothetical protein
MAAGGPAFELPKLPQLWVPHPWLEFDVDSVEKATAELESQGYRMLVKTRKEPWGQAVSRFLGPEGLLLGIAFTPAMRQEE